MLHFVLALATLHPFMHKSQSVSGFGLAYFVKWQVLVHYSGSTRVPPTHPLQTETSLPATINRGPPFLTEFHQPMKQHDMGCLCVR